MKRILILSSWLLVAVWAQAQLTLDECRRLARENYPEIRQYDLVRQTEEYNLSNAARAWIPQVSLNAQATWQSAVTSYPKELVGMLAQQGVDIPGLNKDQYKIALSLNQTIWDGGKSAADRSIARAEATEQRLMTDVNLYDLERRVDELFFGILLLDENLAQTRLTADLLASNLEKVRSLQKNGVAMQSDVDAVEAETLTVGQQIVLLEASQESFRQMLSLFIGQSLGDNTLRRPEAIQPTLGEPNRPELAMFAANIDKLTAQERLIKSASMPRLSLFAEGYYGYPGLDFMENMMNSDWSWNAIVGVRLSWNFGAYYTQKNNLEKVRTAQRRVEVQRDVFLFNNRLQVAQENGEITRLRKAVADDDRIVALRRSVREAAESKLRNGTIDTNDLLRKITEESAASTTRNAREIELLKAIYELNHTINR